MPPDIDCLALHNLWLRLCYASHTEKSKQNSNTSSCDAHEPAAVMSCALPRNFERRTRKGKKAPVTEASCDAQERELVAEASNDAKRRGVVAEVSCEAKRSGPVTEASCDAQGWAAVTGDPTMHKARPHRTNCLWVLIFPFYVTSWQGCVLMMPQKFKKNKLGVVS